MRDQNQGYGQSDVKYENRNLILQLIREEQPVTRMSLAKMTDLSPTSITRIISMFKEMSLLQEDQDAPASGKVGRPGTAISINPDAFYTTGVHMLNNALWITLVDYGLTSRCQSVFSHPSLCDMAPETVCDIIVQDVQTLIQQSGVSPDRVRQVGLATAGAVSQDKGVILQHPGFGWQNVSIAHMLQARLNRVVTVEDNIKASCLYQYSNFKGSGIRSFGYLHFSMYPGFSFIADGRIVRGANNCLGEISAGGSNALSEHYSVQRAYRRDYERFCQEPDLLERYQAGDADIVRFVEELAVMINQLTCFFDPEIMMLGGYLSHGQPELLQKAIDLEEAYFRPLYNKDRYYLAKDALWSSAKGIALMAQERYINNMVSELCNS